MSWDKLPLPHGSLPELDQGDKTDPDVFGCRPEQESAELDTVPRCVTCSRPTETPTSFDQGMIHALNGAYFVLCKRLDRATAAALAIWLKEEIMGAQNGPDGSHQVTYWSRLKD